MVDQNSLETRYPMSSAREWIVRLVRSLCVLLVVAVGMQSTLATAQTVYFHNDPAGSPLAATDAAGNLLWKESYRPYGAQMVKPATTNTQWFHGKKLDSDTGLEDFGARNYDPVLGRFLSVDPIEFSDKNIHSFNKYAYGYNNPLKYKDPDGNLPILIPIAIYVFSNAAIGAGFDYAIQKAVGGSVNWTQVALSGAISGIVGGEYGAGAGATTTLIRASSAAKGPGTFVSVSESMSANAAAYQARVAGTNGSAYVVNGVKFDGFANGMLIDAKAGYAQFVKDGQFRSWFSGADSLVAQAQRQLNAANGTPIQWRFAEEVAANATRVLFQQRGVTGIDIVHVP